MVALWEQAFLFKNEIPKDRWKGWEEWIEFHLQKSDMVKEGALICVEMYDPDFREFLKEKVSRIKKKVPQ